MVQSIMPISMNESILFLKTQRIRLEYQSIETTMKNKKITKHYDAYNTEKIPHKNS